MNILSDLYSEYQLIALLIQYPEKWGSQIFSVIRPEMFRDDYNRAIFEYCRELRDQNKEINLLAFQDNKKFLPHIIEILPIIAGVNGIDYRPLIEKILTDYKHRALRRMAAKVIDQAKDSGSSIEEIFRYIEDTRMSLDVTTSNNFKSLADIIDETGNTEAYKGMTVSCLTTGWHVFDSKVVIKPGDLIILAGRPSMGKTDWALQFAKAIGSHNHSSAIFSIETAGQYLNKRLAGGSNLQEYLEGCAKNIRLPIYIDDNPIQSLFSARAQLEYARKQFGIEIAILDYLSLMDIPKQENRNREIEELVKGLKILARETMIPLLVIAQLNRGVEGRRDRRPMLSDLRDSGAIEQVADIVLMAYRPIYYGINQIDDITETANYLEIISLKQREGARGILQFYYDAAKKKIGDWAGDKIEYDNYRPISESVPEPEAVPDGVPF